jgi:predicted permease
VPAWRAARVDLVDALKDGSQSASASGHRQRLRGALVIAEVAIALVLLTGAGLMLRSLWNLQRIDLGFDPDRVLTLRLALPASQYDTPEKVIDFYDRLLTEVRALPGVERAGLVRLLPLATAIGDWGLAIEGFTPPPGVNTPGDWQIATAGGAEALGERLITGRWLTDADRAGALDVALINEAMAQKYWPGQSALGRRFRQGSPDRPWITVVGIVGNVRHNGITTEIKPKFYRAFAQWHLSSGGPARNMTLVVKSSGDPSALVAPVRAEIRRLDGNLPIAAIRTMDDVVSGAIATPRLTGTMLGAFAMLALLLAAMGIYSVLSYVVSIRRQEIGIRLAIGALPSRVLRLVVRQGIMYAAIGTAIGLAVSAVAARILASLLHDVAPHDPMTFVSAPMVLVVVATLASLVPGWRATRVDPVSAMRSE